MDFDLLIDFAPSATLFIAAIGVIAGLVRLGRDIRWSTAARNFDIMLKFAERFEGEEMLRKRKIAGTFLLANRGKFDPNNTEWRQVDDLLDFFQIIGTLVREGQSNPKISYNFFHYWFSHYWLSCSEYVIETQKEAPMQWAEAKLLFEKLNAFETKYNKGRHSNPTDEEFEAFFRDEQSILISDYGPKE